MPLRLHRGSFPAVLAALLPLLAAGCGPAQKAWQDATGGASVAPEAEVMLQPGQWQLMIKLAKLEIPGTPADVVKRAEAQLAQKPDSKLICLTEQDVANPGFRMIGLDSQECRQERFTLHQGKLDGAVSCETRGGPKGQITLSGTCTPGSCSANMRIAMQNANDQAMTMTMALASQYKGACTGKEEK